MEPKRNFNKNITFLSYKNIMSFKRSEGSEGKYINRLIYCMKCFLYF